MKYVELINPEYLIPCENELYKKYNITRRFTDTSYFMHFYPCQMQSRSYRGINTNWKARLSIHPEDINKAWEIILPFLYQRDIPFKVINLNAIEKFKKDRQEKLERVIEEYNQFLQNSNSQNIDFLRTNFYRTYQELKHIETLSSEIKKGLITDCLNKSSNLGKFFRIQRGIFSPKLGHGTLKQLEDIYLINNGNG